MAYEMTASEIVEKLLGYDPTTRPCNVQGSGIYLREWMAPAWMGQRKQLYTRTVPATVGSIGRVPPVLTPEETDYLRERFRKANHPKYHKYCDEWMQGLMPDQLRYFRQEAHRLGWQWHGLRGGAKE